MALGASLARDPLKIARAQTRMFCDYLSLGTRMLNCEAESAPLAPEPGDRRFRDEAWQNNLLFDVLKQHYLSTLR